MEERRGRRRPGKGSRGGREAGGAELPQRPAGRAGGGRGCARVTWSRPPPRPPPWPPRSAAAGSLGAALLLSGAPRGAPLAARRLPPLSLRSPLPGRRARRPAHEGAPRPPPPPARGGAALSGRRSRPLPEGAMEVNAGKSRAAAAGRGPAEGTLAARSGHLTGAAAKGVSPHRGGGVGCRGTRTLLGLGSRRPAGRPAVALPVPLPAPRTAAARPGGAGRPPPHMAGPREPRARCVYVRRRAGAGWLGGRVTRHYIMGGGGRGHVRPLGSVTHILPGRRDTWGRGRGRARSAGSSAASREAPPLGRLRAVTWPRCPPPSLRGVCTARACARARAEIPSSFPLPVPSPSAGARLRGGRGCRSAPPARRGGDPDAGAGA